MFWQNSSDFARAWSEVDACQLMPLHWRAACAVFEWQRGGARSQWCERGRRREDGIRITADRDATVTLCVQQARNHVRSMRFEVGEQPLPAQFMIVAPLRAVLRCLVIFLCMVTVWRVVWLDRRACTVRHGKAAMSPPTEPQVGEQRCPPLAESGQRSLARAVCATEVRIRAGVDYYVAVEGWDSHGRCCHSDAPRYVSFVFPHKKCNNGRLNDRRAHG